jgi:FeS assembly protein IscX
MNGKTLRWTDVLRIAEKLAEAHPEVKPLEVRFTDLHRWVTQLPDFGDDPQKSNEKILEAIQMAWIDELE